MIFMTNTNESGQLLDLLSKYFAKLLPIIGVILLIALIFLVWEIIKFIKGLAKTVEQLNGTLETVDLSVNKLQAPLNTVESLSYSVDSIHIASKKAVNKSVSMITDNYGVIKDWVSTFFDEKKAEKKQ